MKTALVAVLLALAPALAPPEAITVLSPRGSRRIAVTAERGFPAVSAEQIAVVLSWDLAPSPAGTATLRAAGTSFAFVLDAGYFRHDGQVYTLAAGPYLARDSLFVPLQFITEYLPRLSRRYRYDAARLRLEETASAVAAAPARPTPPRDAERPAPAPAAASRGRRVIAIDPGHGGIDRGMSGPIGRAAFLREKEVTLGVARALARELESRGFRAALTRDRDTLIALGDRGKIARRAGADLFVSIHVNAANPRWRNARTARGFETYFLAEARTEDAARVAAMENASVSFETDAQAERGDPVSFILRDLAQNEHLRESSRLAELVQGSLGQVHPSESRGVKQAGFMVLATSYMPAILIETGFGSNDAEARYLTGAPGQQRLARAIAEGIERYMEEFERRLPGGGP